jgi:hypothetical protein
MQIIPTFSFAAGATTQDIGQFEAAVNFVIAYFDATFTNNVTINVDFAYGEQYSSDSGGVISFTPMVAAKNQTFELGHSETWFTSENYNAALNALAANANGDQAQASSTLSPFTPFGGATLWTANAEAKALGLSVVSNAAGFDGVIGIISSEALQTAGYSADWSTSAPTAGNQFYMIGVIEHELTEVMGRQSIDGLNDIGNAPGYTIMDFYRYSAPGMIQVLGGNPSYFSLDGGVTPLLYWNNLLLKPGDLGDWAPSGPGGVDPTGNDSFLNDSPSGVINGVSNIDLALMNALGWDIAPASPASQVWIDDANGEIATLNPSNGIVTLVGASGVGLSDIAFNHQGQLFGISFTALYSINPQTGAATLIGDLSAGGGEMNGLKFGPDGTLYAVSSATEQLYTINTATGAATALNGTLQAASAGDIAFEHGVLYLADANGALEKLTISNGTVSASVVGPIGFSAVDGLATGPNGELYGVSGDQLILINTTTGAGTAVTSFAGMGLQAAYGMDVLPLPTPQVTGVGVTGVGGSGVLTPSQTATITLDWNESVTVSGAPTLVLNDGGVATYVGGSGTSALTFSYTVAATDANVASLAAASLILNGGSIVDVNGDPAALPIGSFSQSGPAVNTTTPVIAEVVTAPQGAHLASGATVTIALDFNEAVTVSGAPTLTLSNGASATFVSGSGGHDLIFTYAVGASGADGATLTATQLNLNGGAIDDVVGNAATLSLAGIPTTHYDAVLAAPTGGGVVTGGTGADALLINGGGDTVNGGAGVTTAIFAGTVEQYAINVAGATVTVSDDVNGRDGVDILNNVQQAKFSDITLVFDLHSGEDLLVYELYQATYNRTPDLAGFRYWAGVADANHMSALALADQFLAAPEFTQIYGANPTNLQYVTELYTHVLGRTPDQAGLDYWVGQANTGQPRDQLLVDFAISAENVTLITPHTAHGYWTT